MIALKNGTTLSGVIKNAVENEIKQPLREEPTNACTCFRRFVSFISVVRFPSDEYPGRKRPLKSEIRLVPPSSHVW